MGNYFDGKVALVTGGAAGLGRGLCEALAREGAHVIVSARSLANAEAVVAELGADTSSALALDVIDPDAVAAAIEHAVEHHGRIDFVFNNAGIAVAGQVQDVTPEMFKKVIDVNLLGAAYVTQAAYAQMIDQGSGHIVNIGSMYGLVPGALQSAYVAAKHGLTGLTLSLAAEAGHHGVDVSLICPGYIETSLFSSGTYESGFDADSAKAAIPFKLIDIEPAVDKIMAGVRRRQLIVAYPGYVRWGWRLTRLSQVLFRFYNSWQFRKTLPR